MKILFYQSKANRCPAKEFIATFQARDKAKILACLKNVEELGFDCPRVQFRQIRGYLWEIKIRTPSTGVRLFYAALKENVLIVLHGYCKQSKKAPEKEIIVAETRLKEVLKNEKNYFR